MSEVKKTEERQGSALAKAFSEIAEPFKGLAHSSRALWGLYISYLLEGLVYFGVLTVLGKYLSENVGLSDLHAGWVYSGFTGGITLAMLFLGGLSDKLGVRKALMLSLGIMIFGRALLGASGTFFEQELGASSAMFLTVVLGLFIIVLGYGTYQPAAYSAVKQFTNKKTASISYAMIYGLMNLGAFFSGIISPVIRDSGGIKAVYWVYTGLCIIAFATVVFVMSRKAVEEGTLSDEDETAGEKKGEGKEAKPTAVAKPLAKLMTPGFLVFVSASALSVIAVIFMVITARVQPEVQALRDVHEVVKKMDIGDDNPSADLVQMAVAIEEQAAKLGNPVASHPDGSVDLPTFTLVQLQLNEDGRMLRALAAQSDQSFEAGSESALLAFDDVRTLGLMYMAAAYAQVSPVDDKVIDNLRSRLKEAGAEPLPLTAGQMTSLKDLVARDGFPALSLGLAEVTDETLASLKKNNPQAAIILEPWLQANLHLFKTAGSAATGSSASDVVHERLLDQSVLLAKDLAPEFKNELAEEGFWPGLWRKVTGGEEATLEAKSVNAIDVAKLYAGSLVQYYSKDHLGGLISSAETLPGSVSFLRWAKRYGWLILAAIVCLLVMGSMLLQKRPEHPFNDQKFVFFIFILVPVQTLFAHNWLTLPYYIDRAFGGTSVGDNFEFFSNLNPILIFFLAPIVAALTTRAKVYPMMIWGTLVMAVPTFLLVLPPTPFLLLAYIILMSIGEAMWQPRFLQWVAEIAPEGQTGTYMGIGQFPWFLTKVLTGLYSGYFLSQYCPAVGPQNTQFMWLIYSGIAMVTPIGLVLARKWMLAKSEERAA